MSLLGPLLFGLMEQVPLCLPGESLSPVIGSLAAAPSGPRPHPRPHAATHLRLHCEHWTDARLSVTKYSSTSLLSQPPRVHVHCSCIFRSLRGTLQRLAGTATDQFSWASCLTDTDSHQPCCPVLCTSPPGPSFHSDDRHPLTRVLTLTPPSCAPHNNNNNKCPLQQSSSIPTRAH